MRSGNRNEKDQDQRVRFIIFYHNPNLDCGTKKKVFVQCADTELQTTFLMFNLILGQ